MPKIRSPKPVEMSTRDQLTADFVEHLARDFAVHGTEAVERVRKEAPAKYAELVLRLIPMQTPTAPGIGDYSQCSTPREIADKILADLGCEHADDEARSAVFDAYEAFMDKLEAIRDRLHYRGNGYDAEATTER
jgi:hypothetical protein